MQLPVAGVRKWCEELLAGFLVEGRAMCSQLLTSSSVEQQHTRNLNNTLTHEVALLTDATRQLIRGNQIRIDTEVCFYTRKCPDRPLPLLL